MSEITPSTGPPGPLRPAADLVGRVDELLLLRRSIDEATAGSGGAMWIEGDPGVGKTALLDAAACHARSSGLRVVAAAGTETGQEFGLRLFGDALNVAGSADEEIAEIGRMMHQAGRPGLVSTASNVAAAAERILDLVESWCGTAPVVLAFDDLHWADELSLAVCRRLLAFTARQPLLLLLTSRPASGRRQVAAVRRALTKPGGTGVVALRPLSEPDVAALAARLIGGAPSDRLRELLAQAGGNPLFVHELTGALMGSGAVAVHDSAAELVVRPGTLPSSLPAAIEQRLGLLRPATLDAMSAAAVLADTFDVYDLTHVTGRGVVDMAAAVTEAVAAGVLVESGLRLTFRHGLIRRRLYERIEPERRLSLHRAAARELTAAGAAPERVAEHVLAMTGTVDPWALDWIAESGPVLAYRAPTVATGLLTRALDVMGDHDPRRDQLNACMVTALFQQAGHAEVIAHARAVLPRVADPELAARITWTFAYSLIRTGGFGEAGEVVEQVLARRLPPVWRARLVVMRAMVHGAAGDLDRCDELAARAESDGTALDDPHTVAYALHLLFMTRGLLRRDPDTSLALSERALRAAGADPELTDLRLTLLANRLPVLAMTSTDVELQRTIAESVSLAERLGSPKLLNGMRVLAADAYLAAGKWDAALVELEAVDAGDVERSLWLGALSGAAFIHVHRGDMIGYAAAAAQAEKLPIAGTDHRHNLTGLRLAQAVAAERAGDHAAAVKILADLTGVGQGAELTITLAIHLPELVRVARRAGLDAIAQDAVTAARDVAATSPSPVVAVAAAFCEALLAGDPVALLAVAGDCAARGQVLLRGQALEAAALAFAGRDDRASARAAYTEAVAVYETLGANGDIARAGQRLREYGIRPVRRVAESVGWPSLSPAELKVARLVARGMSNPDIGRELHLSRRTVQTHVSRILAKLQVRSRVDIARTAPD